MNKTRRKRGEVFAVILQTMERLGQITMADLPIDRKRASSALRHLVNSGRVKKVKEATLGRYGEPAIYELGETRRKAA